VAADVSTTPGRMGRAGWTWYTGSAGWMYRIWIEEVLGFKLRGDSLTFQPVLPPDWPGFELTYRFRSSTYHIKVQPDAPLDAIDIVVDNEAVSGDRIRLQDDGKAHDVVFRVPKPQPRLLASGERASEKSAGVDENEFATSEAARDV